MTRRDWSRPQYRFRGREHESIAGDDIPRCMSGPPRPRQPKQAMRAEADGLVKAFLERRGTGASADEKYCGGVEMRAGVNDGQSINPSVSKKTQK